MGEPPILVAATDDERLARPDLLARLDLMLAAGLAAVWLRGPATPARTLYDLGCEAKRRCDARGARLWIGDRADLARAVRADAVQLPARGLSVAAARVVVGPRVRVGRSVHSVDAARRAAEEGADHLVVGAIHPTASHPDQGGGGPERIAAIRAALPDGPPLLAIGGLVPDRVGAVLAAGAVGVVAIRALWDAPDPTAAVRAFLTALGRGGSQPLD